MLFLYSSRRAIQPTFPCRRRGKDSSQSALQTAMLAKCSPNRGPRETESIGLRAPRAKGLGCGARESIWEFPKLGVPYFGVLKIRLLLFRGLH